MADQKISELQLVVATGITPTGVYMPLYTPMMSPQNRRMSVPELFKSPPRLEVKDTSVAGNGEIATLTTSYGTASLRVGTGGQFIVGGAFRRGRARSRRWCTKRHTSIPPGFGWHANHVRGITDQLPICRCRAVHTAHSCGIRIEIG